MTKSCLQVPVVLAFLTLMEGCGGRVHGSDITEPSSGGDPYLWLEDVRSETAMAFVKEQSGRTEDAFSGLPGFSQLRQEMESLYGHQGEPAFPTFLGSHVYNFLTDNEHPRGIWRRAPWKRYRSGHGAVDWETILDLDDLSAREGEAWTWGGADCFSERKCLVRLSRAGRDAMVVREFDPRRKVFLKRNPFNLPEGRHASAWLDRDTLLVALDQGGESLTESGYPRSVRVWKRGAPPDGSPPIFVAERTDVAVRPFVLRHGGSKVQLIQRYRTLFGSDWLVGEISPSALSLPGDAAVVGLFGSLTLVTLRSDWDFGGKRFPGGSLITFDAGRNEPVELLFSPSPSSSLTGVSITRQGVVVSVLDNVVSRIRLLRRGLEGWDAVEIPLPDLGTASIYAASEKAHEFFVSFESFLKPPGLLEVRFEGDEPRVTQVTMLRERFDASPFATTQHWTTSRDGTRIPYFLVRRKDAPLNGETPTLLSGYGGFGVASVPWYSSAVGKIWLARGGAYAVANTRGGGEFGPEWHEAAVREHRPRAFEDFIAVAEALMAQGVTSPARLGISGESNGGLLVGAVMVMRPDLFGAILGKVPLLDMLRYHKLFHGATWVEEYGNPDDGGPVAEVIRGYSPYQNVKTGVEYPPAMFVTSTADDRVHPGHARKMVARMREQGHEAWLLEDTEGGHGGQTDVKQRAHSDSLKWAFFIQRLMGNFR